jgi:bile acid-coenzyme A ligase
MRRFDPLEALRLIDAYKVSWVNFVPTMMHRIWSLPAEKRAAFDLSSRRIVFYMASPMPPWLKDVWINWLGPQRIWELYGGTERQGATIINGTEWLMHRGSVGRIQGEDQLKIFNEDAEECKPGEVGEIFFKSAGGQGSTYYYVGAKAKEREGGWESIGDMGWMDEEGYLYLADRRTDLILRGGANIYPAEVEAALDAMNLHRFLTERIARYKVPESYEFTENCLRDDAGKVRRSALRVERITWLREGRAFRVVVAHHFEKPERH